MLGLTVGVNTLQDFHLLLAKKEYHHLKAMLFMFHVCHFMLVLRQPRFIH
jgi:hypothetical protein